MLTDRSTNVKVSVIIPTLNAGLEFVELIQRLQKQTLLPYEIIVMDSSSEDGTPERALQLGTRVLTVLRSEFDHGGTRNTAAAQAKGDFFVFMTQDALPYDEQLLEKLVQPLLDDARTACSYARQIPYPHAGILERLARASNYPREPRLKSKADIDQMGIQTFICSNVCAAYRRETFYEMGSFDAPVIFNEDMFMAATCVMNGYSIAYAAEAGVYHSHDYTLMQQFRRFFDNGVSMCRNEWIIPFSKVGKPGFKLVKTQLQCLLKEHRYHLIPVLFAESAAKLIGYKLGIKHKRLPVFLCRYFSMHKLIWDRMHRVNDASTPMKRTG
ncbi:glycosyltransferase family 2 protein [Paenibacillus sp. Leaf72]|uniref:glycosyltransferase family 2 protein n=1 Tax=Paenibacillus sp. Leaf72 TaxID=1736234 RepID=UPI0006F200F6|nr:glycosyltransferase family 2 protein [Paenibacillus sp. Leaf72]KQO15372.1 glycosyl transferase family 2 [Paenibacillus sp. Leaf72]